MPLLASPNEEIHCPYCQKIGKFHFPFYTRSYYRCQSCGLIFHARREDIKTTISYYQDFYFDNNAEDQLSGQRTDIYRRILNLLKNYKDTGSLLDIGCGCGFFLKNAEESGWKVTGVDPSRKSISFAERLIPNGAFFASLDDVPLTNHFDVITMINSLDHMVDAFTQLEKAKALLSSGGVLYLRFPNGSFHSFLARLSLMLTNRQFLNHALVFHEYAFTSGTIRRILHDMGFEDVMVSNAPITGGGLLIASYLKGLIWIFFGMLKRISGGRWIWGPSIDVVARKGMKGRIP